MLLMMAASFLFATGGLVLKFVNWNPLAINGIRSFFGAAVLALFLKGSHHSLKINRTVFTGALAYMGMTTLFTLANKMTTAANAIVLQFTCPIWIIVISWIFFHKKPGSREWIASALTLSGITLFFIDSLGSGHIAGDLVALVSGICYALLFMQNSLEDGDALSSVFIGQVLSFIVLGGFVFLETDFSGPVLASVIWLGAMQVGMAYIFFSLGTALIDPLSACLMTGLEPILNPLMVSMFWHEYLSPVSLAGAAIVICSIVGYSLLDLCRPLPSSSALKIAEE